MTAITINAITTAINSMVDGFLSFEQACDAVRTYRIKDKLDTETARTYIQAALLSKKPEYRKQVTENGKPTQDSAFKKAVSRLMRYTDPAYAADAVDQKAEAAEIVVPAHIAKLALLLAQACAEYEGAAKLASTAVAKARASL